MWKYYRNGKIFTVLLPKHCHKPGWQWMTPKSALLSSTLSSSYMSTTKTTTTIAKVSSIPTWLTTIHTNDRMASSTHGSTRALYSNGWSPCTTSSCYSYHGNNMRSFSSHTIHPSTTTTKTNPTDCWEQMNQYTQRLAMDLMDVPSPMDTTNWNNQTNTTTEGVSGVDPVWKRRRAISKAITLIESTLDSEQYQAEMLLTYLLQHQQNQHQPETLLDQGRLCFRVGIAGSPGAGKSTFIEALGKFLLDRTDPTRSLKDNNTSTSTATANPPSTAWFPDHLAVVCVDPSSAVTGGAILGDKTRMSELSRHPRAFVRPAPSQTGNLGGLAPRTDDVLRLLEAVQTYPLLLVETVGLGQSEIEITQSVDMMVLLVPPASGDDLQGVKKGIVEMADLVVVTKADGDLLPAARVTAADYKAAMPFQMGWMGHTTVLKQKKTPTPVLLASSRTGEGLDTVWQKIVDFRQRLVSESIYRRHRQSQNHYWMWKNLQILVKEETNRNPALQQRAKALVEQLDTNQIPPRVAAAQLLETLKLSAK